MSIHTFRRPRKYPEPTTRLAWAIAVAIVLVLAGCGLGLRTAFADDLEDAALAVWATPTPTPEPTAASARERYAPASRGVRPAVARWQGAVAVYDDWDVDQALAVIACESQGDPGAVNPSSGAAGLFQLYRWSHLARRLFGTGDVLVPWVNVGTAHHLWADSGGTFGLHWASSRGCWS